MRLSHVHLAWLALCVWNSRLEAVQTEALHFISPRCCCWLLLKLSLCAAHHIAIQWLTIPPYVAEGPSLWYVCSGENQRRTVC